MKVLFIFVISSLIALSVSYPSEENKMKALAEEVVKDILEEKMEARQESKEEKLSLLRQFVYNQQDEEDENEEEEEEEAELEQAVLEEAVCDVAPPVVEGALSVTYTCRNGFVLTPGPNGSTNSTCQESGEYSAPPTCEPVDCGRLDGRKNGKFNYKGGRTFGSTAFLDCNKSFYRHGDRVQTCQSDGTWSAADERPTCRRCKPLSTSCRRNSECCGSTKCRRRRCAR